MHFLGPWDPVLLVGSRVVGSRPSSAVGWLNGGLLKALQCWWLALGSLFKASQCWWLAKGSKIDILIGSIVIGSRLKDGWRSRLKVWFTHGSKKG